MEKSFGLLFFLKSPRQYQAGEKPVYLRITVNGISVDVSTKRSCEPSQWNVSSGRAIGKNEDAKSLNAYLEVLQRKVYEARKKLLDEEHSVTAQNIKTLITGGELTEKKYMLLEIFQHHNEQMKALVGREYAAGTLERYITSYKHTQSFLRARYQRADIDIKELNFEFITEYEFWLKSVRKCDHNTTMKYLSNFRKIINRCLRNGWLARDPFLGYKMTKRKVDRIALTEFELHAIANKPFAAERLSIVRDIFLFSCYTGLAYADAKKLKHSEIIVGIDGEQWIVSKRQKTDTAIRIPLLAPALAILNKYKEHQQRIVQGLLLPILSNQKMNAYLKEIADVCGITKKLTYHIARHTFATTVTLSNGVPIETVSKMLGHRNIKTTQHYARILDLKIAEDMKVLKEKFQKIM